MVSITFLGTGGGRFATVYQVRRTGGVYLSDTADVHIDPGPGAMLAMRDAGIDPARTDLILISHAHPDHYADAEVAVEGMTSCSLKRKGTVAGSVGSIFGEGDFGPVLSAYHRRIAWNAQALRPGDALALSGMRILATPTAHSDPSGIGFRIETSAGTVSYVSDS
jgi:phosphoribosyl 1,2-cyclic phosphodiesterase